ncbi:glycosyl transferase family 2 [Azospirillum brasilense]|nr:glycosyl transferase family 2 [Azospirillum brasilense]
MGSPLIHDFAPLTLNDTSNDEAAPREAAGPSEAVDATGLPDAEFRYFCINTDVRDKFAATKAITATDHHRENGAREGRLAPTDIRPIATLAGRDEVDGLFRRGEVVVRNLTRSGDKLQVTIMSWAVVATGTVVDATVTWLDVPVPTEATAHVVVGPRHDIVFSVAHAQLPSAADEAALGLLLRDLGAGVDLAGFSPDGNAGYATLKQVPNSPAVMLQGWVPTRHFAACRAFLSVGGGMDPLDITPINPEGREADGLWPDPKTYPVIWWTARFDLGHFPPGDLQVSLSLLNRDSGAVLPFGPFQVAIPQPFRFSVPTAPAGHWGRGQLLFAVLAEPWCDGSAWAQALEAESRIGVFDTLEALKSRYRELQASTNLIVLVPRSPRPPRPERLRRLIDEFVDSDAGYDLAIPPMGSDRWGTVDGACLMARWEVLENILEPAAGHALERLSLLDRFEQAGLRLLVANPPLIAYVETIQSERDPKRWISITGWVSSSEAMEPELELRGATGPVRFDVEWIERPDVWKSHPDHVRATSRGFLLYAAWTDIPVGVQGLTLRSKSGTWSGDVNVGTVQVPPFLFHLEEVRGHGPEGEAEVTVTGWMVAHDGSEIQLVATDGTVLRPTRVTRFARPDVARYAGVGKTGDFGFVATVDGSGMDLSRLALRLQCAEGYREVAASGAQHRPSEIVASVDAPVWVAGQPRMTLTGRVAAPSHDIQWVEVRMADNVLAQEPAVHPVPSALRPHGDLPLRGYCGFQIEVDLSAYAGETVPLRVIARIGDAEHLIQETDVTVPRTTSGQQQQIMASLDVPTDGQGIPEGSPILVGGWAVSGKHHPLRIEVYSGSTLVGADEPRLKRGDVVDALNLPPSQQICGYKILIPRTLAPGEEASLRVVCRDLETEQVLELGTRKVFGTAVNAMTGDRLQHWYAANAINRRSVEDAAALMEGFEWRPKISILMPHYRAKPEWLDRALESVDAQWYRNFEMCVADDGSGDPLYLENLKRLAAVYPWMKLSFCPRNGGIAAATNACADLATGDFVLLFDQDDELAPNCLFEFVKRLNAEPDLDIIYSDSDKTDTYGRRFDLTVKPDFDPDMLLAYMYLNHALMIRRSLFERVGRFRLGLDGSQDHDLALRLVEQTSRVGHIPAVLYHWRVHTGSTALSGNEKPQSFDASIRAIRDALDRRHLPYTDVVRPEWAARSGVGIYQIIWAVRAQPLVSIIIPSRNQAKLLQTCIESIERKTTYPSYEIIIVDDRSDEPDALEFLSNTRHTVVRVPDNGQGFNFSALINAGAAASRGGYLLLLNNDIEVLTPGWIEEMLGWAQQPGMGVVGCRLLFPGGDIVQHAGLTMRLKDGTPGHLFRGEPAYSGGYCSWARIAHGVSAVTFAAAMIPRPVFDALNGLDAEHFPVAYQDPDFCLRARAAGYRVVYTAHADLVHHESLSKPRKFKDSADRLRFQLRWPDPDPFFNPNLVGLGEVPAPADRRVLLTSPRARVRVAALVHNLKLQGAPTSQYLTLRGLAQRHGFDIHILVVGDGPLLGIYEGFAASVTRLVPGATTRDQIVQWLTGLEPDVVYANTLEVTWFVSTALDLGYAPFWNIRESALPAAFFNGDENRQNEARRCLAEAGRLGFVAQTTTDLFRSSGMTLAPQTIIYNGVDLTTFAPLAEWAPRHARLASFGVPSDAIVIGTVGTICPRKAPHLAVRAFIEMQKAMPDQPLWFVSIGEIPPSEYSYGKLLHNVIAESPAPERILLLPEDREIADWYRSLDIFVTASLEESFPRVVIEAMACGLPVVAAAVFGVTEQVINGYTGFATPPGDVPEMAEALRRMIVDGDWRRRLGAQGRAVAEQLYGLDMMVDAYARELRVLREEQG